MKNLGLTFIVIVLVLGGVVVAGVWKVFETSRNRGYAPEQPIPFSHKIHAGDNRMECQYCHFNADKSRHGSIPPMELCMGCHKNVATDSPHIKRMKSLYDEGKSFSWVKIHHVPEHVWFPHRRHVAAGVECQSCHGPIEDMDKVRQHHEFTMGFCLDCHRNNQYVDSELSVGWRSYQTHFDATIFLGETGKYDDFDQEKHAEAMSKVLNISKDTHINAPTECSTCHR